MKIRIYLIVVLSVFVSALLTGCEGESTEKMVLSAKGYLAKNDSKAAIIELKNALQKNPGLAEARFLLGRTLLHSGDATSAAVELRKAIDLKYPETQVVPELAKALNASQDYRKLTDQFGSTTLAERKATADLKSQIAMAYMYQGTGCIAGRFRSGA